jgi:hypothetical protein
VTADEKLSDEYSSEMQAKMGTSLTYVHEAGMNYNRITDSIIVGSCLQVPDDADRCAAAARLCKCVHTSQKGRLARGGSAACRCVLWACPGCVQRRASEQLEMHLHVAFKARFLLDARVNGTGHFNFMLTEPAEHHAATRMLRNAAT